MPAHGHEALLSRLEELSRANDAMALELSQRRREESRLLHESLHDALTQLPNRALLLDRLGRALFRQQRDPQVRCAVLFLDLDHFKQVNDALGHRVGDLVLVEAARRLGAAIRAGDTVVREIEGAPLAARLGGDEFVVLLEDVGDAAGAVGVAQRIVEVLSSPMDIDGRSLALRASVGIALSSDGASAPADLLRNADSAMYRAKLAGRASGRAEVAIYDAAMHEAALDRVMLEAELRQAISLAQLRMAYQPIIRVEDGTIAGFESLMRWDHPVRGAVPPRRFLNVAEDSSLIHALGGWALEEVCRTAAGWRREHPLVLVPPVSVNLSRRQLQDPSLPERVVDALARHGLSASALAFEVTESGVMQALDGTLPALARLRSMGCSILIDDFGTGASSLACLHRFPIDTIKIDQSFVHTLGTNKAYAAVVHAIVTLAHNLDMRVVAEGVEAPDHLVQLQALDCDLAQGRLFAPPADPAQAIAHLVRRAPGATSAA